MPAENAGYYSSDTGLGAENVMIVDQDLFMSIKTKQNS
jgi:hypothetical protein